VIISEKTDKRAAKYLVEDLPFPYTSSAQHEHKLRQPLGQEWTTQSTHRNAIAPKVLVKPGVAINPVDRLF
jgi:U3 small nucleolar RNA-associated protein 14